MRPQRRQAEIAELVSRTGGVSVDALAREFHVSAETIRRDLGQLAEFGLVEKVHGGARRSRLLTEGTFQERMAENLSAKERIADKLLDLVVSGDTIFVDTGTTSLICARRLATVPGLTVITNSVRVAKDLAAGRQSTVCLLGGEFREDNAQTVGPITIEQIRRFQADHAVITIAALDAAAGAMDASIEESYVARAMIECSRSLFIVADASKFDRKAAFGVCRLDEIDVLVSDRRPAPALSAALGRADVEIL